MDLFNIVFAYRCLRKCSFFLLIQLEKMLTFRDFLETVMIFGHSRGGPTDLHEKVISFGHSLYMIGLYSHDFPNEDNIV